MRLNKKGTSMVEIIVAIALVSIVLIFLMNLFVKVRGTYNQSKMQAEYEILVANVIKAVGNDIQNYGLVSVEYEDEDKDAVILTFDSFRPSHLSEPIKKVLRVYLSGSRFFISYSYESNYLEAPVTSTERITSVIREMPEDVHLYSDDFIELDMLDGEDGNEQAMDVAKIKIPMANKNGTIYDINIYGFLEYKGVPQ